MKTRIFLLVSVSIIVTLNFLIYQKQSALNSGSTVLLRLAPVDPRSLMQGDYMRLRYGLVEDATTALGAVSEHEASDGKLVITLDQNRVARFVRVYRGEALAPGELLLRYRKRGEVRLGAESFFFEEGKASLYEQARYGELKVTANGDSILVGLRNENLELLGS
ncbi:MAG: GDYXXLXY domain-containing protein [Acidobacteriota bacterium]|nr:GDYXXLXY domain-containing protein [Acidobacteriota bacterium]